MNVDVVLKGTDELSSPTKVAASQLTGLGTAAKEAGGRATEAGGLFGVLKDHLGELAAVAGGMVAGNVLMSLTAGVAEQFKAVTSDVADYSEQVRKLSITTGMSTEESSHLITAMKDMNINTDDGTRAMGLFSRNVGLAQIAVQEHAKALPPASKAFDELGVSMTNVDGTMKTSNELFAETADKFKAMPDGLEKSAIASQLFGRSFKELVPLLDLGSEGLKEIAAEADKYGVTLTAANVGAVRQFVLAHKEMDQAVEGARIRIGLALIPALTSLTQTLSGGVVKFQEWLTNINQTYHVTDLVGAALGALGTVVQDTFAKVQQWANDHHVQEWAQNVVVSATQVIAGISQLAPAFAEVFGDILNIVVQVGQLIFEAFSWINPTFAHSPSLVSQVQDGVGAITTAFGTLADVGPVLEGLGSGPIKDLGNGLTEVSTEGKKSLDELSKNIGGLVTEATQQLTALTKQLSDAKSALADFANAPIQGMGASNDAIEKQQELINQTQLALDKAAAGGGLGQQQGLAAELVSAKQHLTDMGKQTKGNAGEMEGLRQHIASVSHELSNMKTGAADPGGLKDTLAQQQAQLKVLQDQAKVDFAPLVYQQKQLADAQDPKKQEKPFAAIVQGIKDQAVEIQRLTPLVAQQQSAVDVLKTAWDNVKNAIQNVNVAQAGGGAGAGVGALKLPDVGAAGGGTFASLDIAGTLATAKVAMGDFQKTVDDARAALEGVHKVLQFVSDGLHQLDAPIKAIANAIGVLTDHNITLRTIFQSTAAGAILSFIDLFNYIQRFVPAVGSFFDQLGTSIQTKMQAVLTWLTSRWPLIVAILIGPVDLAALAIATHWTQIQSTFQNAITMIEDFVRARFQAMQVFFDVIMATILKSFGVVLETIKTTFSDAWQAIYDFLVEKFTAINTWVSGIWGSGLADAVRSVIGVVTDAAKSLGQAIIDAIVNMIKSGVGAIASAISSIVSSAVNAAKAALGGGGGSVPGHAAGTASAPGGWSWVGEAGPELVNLRPGTAVLPASVSRHLAGGQGFAGSGDTINVTVQGALVGISSIDQVVEAIHTGLLKKKRNTSSLGLA